jgi:hypothetical protein
MVKDWCFSNREEHETIVVDEELLSNGVSTSEESQKC